jgi:hypothetical protein
MPKKPVDNITGQTYLERGRPVVVLIRWATTKPGPDEPEMPLLRLAKGGPRNVMIQREDGSVDIRPFRGLRTVKKEESDGNA